MPRLLLVAILVLVYPTIAGAVADLDIEQDVADLLATPVRTGPTELEQRQWAILPEVGYGPETGPVGGVKLTHRNVIGLGVTADLDATYALNRQQRFVATIGWPHGLDDRILVLARLRYDLDPEFDFFGIGNNDVGPHEVSTHLQERTTGDLVVGWRPYPRLALNAGVEVSHVHIGRGDRDDDTPFTVNRFPDLPGVHGGNVNPFELSLVYDSRDGVVRPTRGSRLIVKAAHTNRALLSDFEYTRYVIDASTLVSTANGRHILGIRLDAAYMDGPRRAIPFWELEELGGDDTLRGFFPHRFRGRARGLVSLEYRAGLTSFDFYHLWHVRLDGVVFGEAGRVFIDRNEVGDEFDLGQNSVRHIVSALKYSAGGGLRIALSEALVARIDVGFSDEETGLVYLAFGHTF